MHLMHKRLIQKKLIERRQEKTYVETLRLMAAACHRIAVLDMETGISRLVRADTEELELSGLTGTGKDNSIEYANWAGKDFPGAGSSRFPGGIHDTAQYRVS